MTSTDRATAAPARTLAGTKAAQMAARPEPSAMAGAATNAVRARLQASTRGTDGSAVVPAARVATTTATTA